jgi:hypothetical protein
MQIISLAEIKCNNDIPTCRQCRQFKVEWSIHLTVPFIYNRGHRCVYNATDEVLDSLHETQPRCEYTSFGIVFAQLWPLCFDLFFAHSRVPRSVVGETWWMVG